MAPLFVNLTPEMGFSSRYVGFFAIAVVVTVAEMPGVPRNTPVELFPDGDICPISITLAHFNLSVKLQNYALLE